MNITIRHYLGAAVTIILFVVLGVYSGKKVKTADDFSVSGKSAGSIMVAGTILGTMIGGASTIGTAQTAFATGISAWWFTLGGGISCLIFCLFFTGPFRRQKNVTIPGIIEDAYGEKAGLAATLFISFSMIVNIIPQIISAMALISSFFPLNFSTAAILAVALMIVYVLFGGVWGAGMLGTVKIILTSASLLAGGALALRFFGGAGAMLSKLPPYPFFTFFVQTPGEDLSTMISLLIGVLTGQIYLQAIIAARSLRASRTGTLLSAVIGPLIGLGGVVIGLYMRVHHPEIAAVQALPLFIVRYLPAWLSGVVLATLFFAAIGTGAGLALGICTILSRDLYRRFCSGADDKKNLAVSRILILALFGLSLVVVLMSGGEAMILKWAYLSHGFRGVAAFLPMVTALFLPGKIGGKAGMWATIYGPLVVLAWNILKPLPVEPIFPGLVVSLLILAGGYLSSRKKEEAVQSAALRKGR
ncbi:MAG: sodium:solute symporter family protein [Firmicutes bacterium]|nr:sodium:solute symporter family protein [Bacillota bacterium]